MKRKKTVLVALKIVLAGVLLTWVFNKTHWRDYVVTAREGQTYTVKQYIAPADPGGHGAYVVATGMLWWRGEMTVSTATLVAVDEQAPSPQYTYNGFASSVVGINRLLLGLAMIGSLICISLTAVRWWMLLRIQNIDIHLWEVTRLTFLGHFFNFIVPGTVGGDLVKAYYVSKHTPQTAVVLVSIFVDRLFGFAEMSLLAATMIVVALVGGLQSFEELHQPVVAITVVLGVLALMLTFLLSGGFRRRLHLQKLYRRLPIAHHILAAGGAVRLYKKRFGALTEAIVATVVAHVFYVGAVTLVGMSLSLNVPWYVYFIFVPLITIAGAVPLTPGGVGVVESLYVALFVSKTCSSSEVLALALLARAIPMFWGLPGAIVAVTGPRIPKPDVLEHELGMDEDEGEAEDV